MSEGTLHSINVSRGGVPKLSATTGQIRATGVVGDRQRDLRFHGGPLRAVSLYSMDLIEALQTEGHPIAVGTIGENLTIRGLPWAEVVPGRLLEVGHVLLKLTGYAHPCTKIAGSFCDERFIRVSHKVHPGWSRLYASVEREGEVRVNDRVRISI
jgi:MOSC domain-containing protein YiiM